MDHSKACAFCGTPAALSVDYDLGKWCVAKCRSCGVLQQWPMPSAEALKTFYESDEWTQDPYFCTTTEAIGVEVKAYRSGLDALDALLPSRGLLLDVGCGNGIFMQEALARGWQCEGVELSEPLAVEARRRTGCTVHQAAIEDLTLGEGTYDAVVMCDLIEHVANPRDLMKQSRRLLKVGGVLLIYTPDYGTSLLSIMAQQSYRLTGGRVKMPMIRVFGFAHLIYHSRTSIQRMCDESGFSVERMFFTSIGSERYAISNPVLKIGIGAIDFVSKLIDRQYRMLAACVASDNVTGH